MIAEQNSKFAFWFVFVFGWTNLFKTDPPVACDEVKWGLSERPYGTSSTVKEGEGGGGCCVSYDVENTIVCFR